jgi:hypothetical protein
VIDAFLTALRLGDVEGLMAVLDPDLVVRVDSVGARAGAPQEVRGAQNWAKGGGGDRAVYSTGDVCLVDGAVGAVWAPGGRLDRVLRFAMDERREDC